MTVPTLLTIPNYSPQAGKLPNLPEGYTGYYQSLTCQMVFAFGFREKKGLLYLSKDGWQPHECSPSLLPQVILPGSPEAKWLAACWDTALAQAMNVAMENLFYRVVPGLFKKEQKL
jgi:hypothetical protein